MDEHDIIKAAVVCQDSHHILAAKVLITVHRWLSRKPRPISVRLLSSNKIGTSNATKL